MLQFKNVCKLQKETVKVECTNRDNFLNLISLIIDQFTLILKLRIQNWVF